ncbi:MAG: substrate-binding domain-containing protein [Proteobacteria bacterium]|nr:substrate-binding domain-containing protein [Pseudomonadota bacterium]
MVRCSRRLALVVLVFAGVASLLGPLRANERFIVLASTTSTENSGLFDHILPKFKQQTGIAVRVVAVGTGQAIRLAQRGDADVLLVHHKPSEEAFVAEGYGVVRHDVMYNDFVLVGPRGDPAQTRLETLATRALHRIAQQRHPFVSRGDDSGTHQKERALWAAARIDPRRASGAWYRETGSGMGASLNIAAALDAYTMSDRATWLNFSNKQDLRLLVSGDPALFNQYGIIAVNPARHAHIRAKLARTFVEWMTSEPGQTAIESFRIHGEPGFFPNAKRNVKRHAKRNAKRNDKRNDKR